MSTLWKVAIGLALVLPMLAYVAGSLVASGSTDLPRHEPVVIRDAPLQPTSTPPTLTPRPDPDPDDEDDDDTDDDDVVVVTPKPTRVDDDDGDDRDDRDDRDDDDTDDDSEDDD